jgi:pyruvate/2-oxoglutarate dehydrogenase complex dihydrolipoamide dehydrogenase (E3) component
MIEKNTSELLIEPLDKYNQELIAQVHPFDWNNPEPQKRYNIVVIGGGTAGLVTAAGAAGLGAKVALIERYLIGGDCLNVGCVPSKSLISSSRVMAEIRNASIYGILNTDSAMGDFSAVMERLRAIRAKISHHDSAKRITELGVDVFLGQAEFAGPNAVTVNGKTLRFKKAVITTGARAVTPDIDGIEEAGFLTNETIFNLTEQPRRMAIIGGGPIGCELAQAFARLGTQVTLFHRNKHLLNREDADAAAIIQEQFKQEGIKLVLGCSPFRVETRENEKTLHYKCGETETSVAVDEILAAAGRAPNVENLNLESVGVKYDKRQGIIVNDRLQTTNSRIFAAGDVCMKWKFTHAADAAARIVIQNALFFGRKKLSVLTMPWCTYTDPEIAHVGMYEKDAAEKGIAIDTFVKPLNEVDRAITDGQEQGFVKVHVSKGSDKIIGATVVAKHAGDMISELTLAIVDGIGLGKLSGVIHPYPTQAEAIKQIADAYNRTRLKPGIKKLLTKWFKMTR